MRYSVVYDKEEGNLTIEIPTSEILYAVARSSVLPDTQIHEVMKNPTHFIQKLMDTLFENAPGNTMLEEMIEQLISQAVGDDYDL